MTRKAKAITVNANGLTLRQYAAAVGPIPMQDLSKIRKAWEAGEDPSEWRAHYQQLEAAKRAAR